MDSLVRIDPFSAGDLAADLWGTTQTWWASFCGAFFAETKSLLISQKDVASTGIINFKYDNANIPSI